MGVSYSGVIAYEADVLGKQSLSTFDVKHLTITKREDFGEA
jgi:hypothetical protein